MCNTCPNRYTQNYLDESKEIILPYYREISNFLPSAVSRANYTPYHLFCLKKNIMGLIREINPKCDISFPTKKYDDSMIVTMQLYKAGEAINPDSIMYDLITDNLQSYIDMYPFCLVYRLSDVTKKYNAEWATNILPYIANKTEVLYNGSEIFVNLEDVPNHHTKWQEMYNRITHLLSDYYRRGIVYKPNFELIKKWHLKRIDNELYEAVWQYNFTYDKIEFLYSNNKRMMIYLGENDKIKTKAGWLTIPISNYSQVVELMDSLL